MTTTCLLAWALALLLLPVLLLTWLLETDRDRACRWRRSGLSQQRIADRLGCSRWRVRRLLAPTHKKPRPISPGRGGSPMFHPRLGSSVERPAATGVELILGLGDSQMAPPPGLPGWWAPLHAV
jgi:hypothetical protein